MKHTMKIVLLLTLCSICIFPQLINSQNTNEALEPTFQGDSIINLLQSGNINDWTVPSNRWYIKDNCLTGDSNGKVLEHGEFVYSKQKYGDYEFTCEMRLTGDNHRNTGIYFRIDTFYEKGKEKKFMAPSGYEFDASASKQWRGALAYWYKNPSVRAFPDENIIALIYKEEDWNRMTIRTRGSRQEYWLNGVKIVDFVHDDPKASKYGFIGFQMHGGAMMKVEYRNILVKPL